MSNLGKAYVQVIPSAKGIKGQLSNIFGSEGNSAGTSFGSSLIGKVKGLIAAAGIGKALGESLTAGANLQQSLGGIETLFKDSADIVIRNAEQAYKTAGMSANSYMETVTGFSASLLQGLSGDTEKAAAVADMALTDMADNANKMGTSMELIQNAYQGFAKQNYTMLDNLKLGYGGTKTEMERLLADAQKLTGIKYDISNLSDVYEAIHVIQEEMGITGTTALESAATFTGSLASMKAAFSDLLANLATGRDIRGSLDALSETVFIFAQDNLFPMVGNIFAELPTVLESALSMAIRGLNLVANNADAIVQMGIDLVTGIGTAIISAAPYLLEAALRIVSALGNALLSADWAAIGSTTISALRDNLDIAAGEILGTDGNIVQSVLTAITTHLPNLLSGGSSMVVSVVNGLLQQLPFLLQTGGQLAEQLISTLISFAPEILSAGVTLVLNLANGLIQNLPAVITSAISILGQLLATILSHLPQLLESGISLIGQLAAGLIQAIPQVLAAIPQIINSIVSTFKGWNWREIGSNIVSGIANGISSGASAIISAAQSAARAALNAAKRFLGIASPSKVMRDQVGKFIPEGMAIGIEANTKPLTDAMHDLSDLTTSTAQADIARGAKTTGIPVSTTGNVYGNSTFTINVYASDNMDVDELAETVMQKIQFAVSQREVCFA
jgi:phage-related protein